MLVGLLVASSSGAFFARRQSGPLTLRGDLSGGVHTIRLSSTIVPKDVVRMAAQRSRQRAARGTRIFVFLMALGGVGDRPTWGICAHAMISSCIFFCNHNFFVSVHCVTTRSTKCTSLTGSGLAARTARRERGVYVWPRLPQRTGAVRTLRSG